MKNNQNGAVDFMFLIVLVVLVAAAAFTFWRVNQADETVNNTDANLSNQGSASTGAEGSDGASQNNENASAAGGFNSETGKYDVKAFGNTLSFAAPDSWQVSIERAEDLGNNFTDSEFDEVRATSPGGLVFHARPNAGIGGDCPSNDFTYTLSGFIDTTQSDLVFTEYETNSTEKTYPLGAEWHRTSTFDTEVGETRTDTSNLCFHGVGYDAFFIDLEDADGNALTLEQVEADPDFVALLNSLSVTTSN